MSAPPSPAGSPAPRRAVPNLSPVSLGTANFGSQWGPRWTLEKRETLRLAARAVERGVTAFDTANVYNKGESELWLGGVLRALKISHQVSVTTKYGYLSNPNEPDSGGSGRKPMRRAVDRSLKRLGRDYVDVLYLHLWDRTTPVEETLSAAGELVAAGKVRAFGLSNVPAWYLARAELLSRDAGLKDGLAAVQLNYNLLTRYLEYEYEDALALAGLDLISWGPLANGLLAGRYRIDTARRALEGDGRLTEAAFSTGAVDPFEPGVADTLLRLELIASEAGVSPAHLALAWLVARPQPVSTVIGVSTMAQLDALLDAVDQGVSPDVLAKVEAATQPRDRYPHRFLSPDIQVLAQGPSAFERTPGPLSGVRARGALIETAISPIVPTPKREL